MRTRKIELFSIGMFMTENLMVFIKILKISKIERKKLIIKLMFDLVGLF